MKSTKYPVYRYNTLKKNLSKALVQHPVEIIASEKLRKV